MKGKLNWKPVRRGNIYCSSACGRGCTRVEYDAAVKAAKALAKRMGPNWKWNVWENLGWHYEALLGGMRITPPHMKGAPFTAWINNPPQFLEHDKDPHVALRNVVKRMDAYVNALLEAQAKIHKRLFQ